MGFLQKFFRPQAQNCTLEEAMKRIVPELHAMDASQKDELYSIALRIRDEYGAMLSGIREFSKKPNPPHAKSSEKVKIRFCQIAEKQLTDMKPPEKENPSEFISHSQELINSLGGLTERQVLHLGFFFKDDIQPIARKMRAINELLLKSKSRSTDHARAVKLYKEVRELEAQKKETDAKSKETAARLEKLESRRSAPLIERVDNSYLLIAEKKLQKVRQEIDSFLSVQKMLKRYAHDKNLHDDLIEAYINSPSSAVLEDKNFRILDTIKAARSHDDTGKAESIIDKGDYLKSKRAELLETIQSYEEEKKKYEMESSRAAAATIEAKRKLATLDGEIRDVRKAAEEFAAGSKKLVSELASKRTELCLLASKILDANVA